MNESRRHHYFPQFHLAQWAREDERVVTYDSAGALVPNPKPIAPINVGLEADLYRDDHPDTPLEGVEEWLAAEIDGPGARALSTLLREDALSEVHRVSLARYIMSRDLRVPKTRDFLMTLGQSELDEWRDGIVRDPASFQRSVILDGGPELGPDEIREFAEGCSIQLRRGFWLAFMKNHIQAATPRLLSYGWSLIHADRNCRFVTSDLGIVKCVGSFANIVSHELGWANNDGGWLVPLTPGRLLAIAPGLDPTPQLAQSPFVDIVNRALVTQCERFAFAASENDIHAALE